MRIATILMAILIATSVFLATDAVAKNEVYRWVDENGVVHYGDLPDGQTGAEQINIRTGRDSNTQSSNDPGPAASNQPPEQEPQPSYAQQRRDERAKKRKENAEKQREIAAACDQRRKLVAGLEPSTRVMVEGEDGKVSRMDDNDRLKILAEAKDYIARKCKQ